MRHSPPPQPPLLWQIYLLFWILGVLATAWPFPSCCCALLLVCLERRLRHPLRIALATLLLFTAFAVARHQMAAPAPEPDWLLHAGEKNAGAPRLCGHIAAVQGLPGRRLRILLDNVAQDAPGAAPLPGRLAWTWEQPSAQALPGQAVCLNRRPKPVHGSVNRGTADWRIFWAAREIHWRIWSQGDAGNPSIFGSPTRSAAWRERLRMKFMNTLAPERPFQENKLSQAQAILPALLFGDRRFLDQRTMELFSAASLAHSLALSGQHLAVAGLAGLLCVLLVARVRPAVYLTKPRVILVTLASCPPAIAYLWLGGAPASLVRAAGMLLITGLWLLRSKVLTTTDILAATLACICCVTPLSILDTGLQLSALCVAAIGLLLPLLRQMPDTGAAWKKRALQLLLLSFGIQVALLPLNLLLFGNAGFWFALNLLWLPVLGFLVLPGAMLGLAAAACGLSPVAQGILHLVVIPCQWLVDGLNQLDAMGILQGPLFLRPHWTTLPAFACLSAAVACQYADKRPAAKRSQTLRRLVSIGLLLLCAGPALRMAERHCGDVRLDILDVGQGQSVALHIPGHGRLLVDGGGSASPHFDPGKALVAPTLTYNDAPRLACVISSHPDIDHTGGLFYLLNRFNVDAIFHNGREGHGQLAQRWRDLLEKLPASPLVEGDTLTLGSPEQGLKLEVLHPPRENAGNAWRDNDASLVLRLTRHGKGLAIFSGDVGRKGLQRMLETGRDLEAQVLVAPHHGSDKNFLPDFYKAVRPRLVVASCGFMNRFRHPGERLRKWLSQNDIPLIDTGNAGEISVSWSQGESFRLHALRQ